MWHTPGGGINHGEQAAEAAVRELFEETRLSIGPDELGRMVAVTSGTADIGWIAGEFHDACLFYRVSRHNVDISDLPAGKRPGEPVLLPWHH